MENLFLLFETDVWKSKKSRVLVGVFTSKKLAEIFAKKEKIESTISCAEIIEIQKNQTISI